LIILIEEKTKM